MLIQNHILTNTCANLTRSGCLDYHVTDECTSVSTNEPDNEESLINVCNVGVYFANLVFRDHVQQFSKMMTMTTTYVVY